MNNSTKDNNIIYALALQHDQIITIGVKYYLWIVMFDRGLSRQGDVILFTKQTEGRFEVHTKQETQYNFPHLNVKYLNNDNDPIIIHILSSSFTSMEEQYCSQYLSTQCSLSDDKGTGAL